MTDKIPAHRAGTTARSGDTHVIGADGKARKIAEPDRKAQEADAARAYAKAAEAKAAAAEKAAAKDAAKAASGKSNTSEPAS